MEAKSRGEILLRSRISALSPHRSLINFKGKSNKGTVGKQGNTWVGDGVGGRFFTENF